MKCQSINYLILSSVLFFLGCNSPDKTKTIDNLKTVYKLETIANAKYAAYAKQTREEDFDRLSVVLLAASKSAGIQAENYKTEIEKLGSIVDEVRPEFVVKTTKENIVAAIEEINNELVKLYPKFINKAETENISNAKKLFICTQEIENKHILYFKDALQAIELDMTNSFYTFYFVCPKCGNTILPQHAENECNLCRTKRDKFIPVG